MKLTRTQRQILYALRRFYESINQPLSEKHLSLKTSKIAFIELLLTSGIITKQERALYKNLEFLEQENLIKYDQRKISFTNNGIKILQKIDTEVQQFIAIREFFKEPKKPKRRLQTTIS